MATDEKQGGQPRFIASRTEDYAQWYVDVVLKTKLADYAPVAGCMIIRPYGYTLWENMVRGLDGMFKETGHENMYFPALIPESFLKKEAEHVEGFAPECAVVTHGGGKKLEEPLVFRPTSETIIWAAYKKWISSYRDLPLLYNQWANVVRWEMRTRLFLRTTEFLWQEGHTAHATAAEAQAEALTILDVYRRFAEEWLALPVLCGEKTARERFAGAVRTYCIEAMMGDKRALQSGTSHFLGQNFAKAFDVTFQNENGEHEYVWGTSWGVSTRLVGAIVMGHGDDKGLALPPRVAPTQVVVVPIYRTDDEKARVLAAAHAIPKALPKDVRIKIDDRDQMKPGWKFNEWELCGVPLRVELGPRDLQSEQVTIARRDTGEKSALPIATVGEGIPRLLDAVQHGLYDRALRFREANTFPIDTFEDFRRQVEEGGFLLSRWCGDDSCEAAVQEETKATIRCIPLDRPEDPGPCVRCGKPATGREVFARAY